MNKTFSTTFSLANLLGTLIFSLAYATTEPFTEDEFKKSVSNNAGIQGGLAQSASMMTFFGVGLSVPLLVVAYGFRRFVQNKKSTLMKINNIGTKILGASIALVGSLMLSGIDKYLESQISSVLPTWFLQLSSFI